MTLCPCDRFDFPLPLAIPPGLAILPRQSVTYPIARRFLLAEVGSKEALAEWRAREGDDLGLMLFGMWAYLLDNLGFYDAELSRESYIGTARRRLSLDRIARLLGYRPRPATAALATIFAAADGVEPVLIPAGTAFRSDAFDDEAAQVFELIDDMRIEPTRNAWRVQPYRPSVFSGEIILRSTDRAPGPEDVTVIDDNGTLRAARTDEPEQFDANDGAKYRRLKFIGTAPSITATDVGDLRLFLMTQTANRFPKAEPDGPPGSTFLDASATGVPLDALYPQIHKGDRVVYETSGGTLVAKTVVDIYRTFLQIGAVSSSTVPVTTLELGISATTAAAVQRVHLRPVPLGRPTNPALPDLDPGQLSGAVALEGVYPEPADPEGDDLLLVKGAGTTSEILEGTVETDTNGAATATITAGAVPEPLRIPVDLHGNFLELTRGETVRGEVIASGDPSIPFLTATLKKKPLTFVEDAAGIPRPELTVRVNGIAWRRVDSLIVAQPGEQIYELRIRDDETAEIRFGDLTRPDAGVRNIAVDYRFGAGGARPPAGAILRPKGRVAGLRRVIWSRAARGGSDRAGPDEIRAAAPAATLTFGRPVSMADYVALARQASAVRAAEADLAWSGRFLRAAITVWIISDGPSVADDLTVTLQAAGDPEVAVEAIEATPVPASLWLRIEADPDRDPEEVRAAVELALAEPYIGALAPEVIGIGRALFRSALVKAVHNVPGVLAITGLVIQPAGDPAGLRPATGSYLDFADVTVEAAS
nr:hypothetical protein [uncultured bacterium]